MTPVYDEHAVLIGSLDLDEDRHNARAIVIPYRGEEGFSQMELVWGEFVREDESRIRALRVHSSLVEQLRSCRGFVPVNR